MKATIMGKGPVIKGDSKKTNKPYHGQTLYLSLQKPGVEGSAAQEQYISFLELKEPYPVYKVGDHVLLDYDNNGFLLGIEIITKP